MTERTGPAPQVLGAILVAGTLLAPCRTAAQAPARAARIAFLSAGAPVAGPNPPLTEFLRRMRDLGYEEGRSITIEFRWAEGKTERLPELAGELVRQKVDVIVATSTFAARAAQQATTTIPIVMSVFDALADGLVSNLARPGGNLTGVTAMSTELMGKRFQLLRAAVPWVGRVGFLVQRREPGAFGTLAERERASQAYLARYGAAAQPLSMTVHQAQASGPDEIRRAIPELVRDGAQALYVLESPELQVHRALIAGLALRHRLPTMFGNRRFVDAGGLMSYSADSLESSRRLANYVDRILKGARPGDLPVEQPSRFELVINLRTAKALGVTVPSLVLAQADEIIR